MTELEEQIASCEKELGSTGELGISAVLGDGLPLAVVGSNQQFFTCFNELIENFSSLVYTLPMVYHYEIKLYE